MSFLTGIYLLVGSVVLIAAADYVAEIRRRRRDPWYQLSRSARRNRGR